MNLFSRRAIAILLLMVTTLTVATATQQKRQAPTKPQPKAAPAPAPAPTFDTLLPADSYVIYGEVRGAGQLIQSSAVNELLEPILKLAGPRKEFKSVLRWLRAHAEEVMNSRLLIAAWPINKEVPETLVAIEFASAEEATKFMNPLNEFLPTVLPTPEPESEKQEEGAKVPIKPKPKPSTPPEPSFQLQQLGSLVVITPKKWTMKQLRPGGNRLLAEDVHFRAARNRFNSEPIFAFVDMRAMQKEEEENRKKQEQLERERAEQAKNEPADPRVTKREVREIEGEKPESDDNPEEAKALLVPQPVKEPPPPDPISGALSAISNSFFAGETNWPEALALALSYEGDSFDLRGLLINAPGEKSDMVPFWPRLIPAAAIVPEAPSILPADTALFATLSLDLPQIYAEMSKPIPPSEYTTSRGQTVTVHKVEHPSPFAEIEKRLQINLKSDLLPLLGPEIALGLPMQNMNILGLPAPQQAATPEPKEKTATDQPPLTERGTFLAIAVRDREALRTLMPKLIDSLGFKGASSFAQTERREDTELISYANLFAYAFIGNFLVISEDAATTRSLVDSYLKHETLASDIHFKNYTRWQPRQVYGQLYVSPALMESYKTWAAQPTTRISDQTRAFLTRVTTVAQPITYSLSNEGLGPLHEVHIPKSLVMMAVAGFSDAVNPPANVQNERMAIGMMYSIAYAQEQYKKNKGGGNCGTLEQLIAADLVPKELIEKSGYRFDVTVSGDKFEATAVPTEYGKTGSLSLFIDSTRVLRGGDRSGATASSSDPPITN